MKTISKIFAIFLSMFLAFNVMAVNTTPCGIFNIHVVMSAKSYWDGASKSCLPREKGGCCHIWFDRAIGPGQMGGNLEMDANLLFTFTTSKSKGMQPETFDQLFRGGKFILDGPLTFSQEVLSKLGLKNDFTIPGGAYPCSFNGDDIIITFK